VCVSSDTCYLLNPLKLTSVSWEVCLDDSKIQNHRLSRIHVLLKWAVKTEQEFKEQVNFESVEVLLLTTMSSSFYEACLQGNMVRSCIHHLGMYTCVRKYNYHWCFSSGTSHRGNWLLIKLILFESVCIAFILRLRTSGLVESSSFNLQMKIFTQRMREDWRYAGNAEVEVGDLDWCKSW